MASSWYTPAKTKVVKGDLDFDTAAVRVKALMSNTTCGSQPTAANLAAFTTIDEYNGSGYTEATLAGVSIASDTVNLRAEISYSNFTFGATVGAGTRQCTGLLVYVRIDGTAANDYPVAFIDLASTPWNGTGGAVNVTVNAEGLLQIQ